MDSVSGSMYGLRLPCPASLPIFMCGRHAQGKQLLHAATRAWRLWINLFQNDPWQGSLEMVERTSDLSTFQTGTSAPLAAQCSAPRRASVTPEEHAPCNSATPVSTTSIQAPGLVQQQPQCESIVSRTTNLNIQHASRLCCSQLPRDRYYCGGLQGPWHPLQHDRALY